MLDGQIILAALGLSEGTTAEDLTAFAVQAKKNEKAVAELETLRADVAEKSTKLTALEAERTDLATKLAAETKRADDSEGELIKLEVESYVGKRITAAEVEDAIADRKREGKASFAKRMEKRADLMLLKNKTPTSGPGSSLANGNPGERFNAAVTQKAK